MFWVIALGIAAGSRTMTPLGVLCWAAWLGFVPVADTPVHWAGTLAALIIFTACAIGEYIGDTLPSTPSRKKLPLALARLAMGIFVGCLIASLLGQPRAGGVIFGGIGALIGTHGGYWVRMRMARFFGRDLPAALIESAMALGLAVLAMYHFHLELLSLTKHIGI
jgi:uncharacterized membrane protein